MGVIRWLKRFIATREPPLNIDEIEQTLGYHFKDTSILLRSLKHRSYSQAVEGNVDASNERLEFFGDSVLNLIVSQALFGDNPDYQGGELTKLQSPLVRKTSTAIAAKKAGINRFIFLSDSEEDAGGRNRTSIIADSYEAVLAAIFLDGGLDAARKFVQWTILDDSDLILGVVQKNYKSLLLEFTQSRKLGHPSYMTIMEDGPDHDKDFTVEVSVRGAPLGRGKGKTKKSAQQLAAKECLKLLKERDGIL
ncbi:MAG: ribonuclease III [Candidatus Latescibacteria bacterium]|nr:ribonuclease III [Candidatus Latescibacterota bacterium]